ncbi:MAG: DMT family transporter [Candidatus Aenigmarchaeota archaeon]|nr:DMT family transporter [Candidatus Aenigmarchaeota archaeon]
MKGLTYVILAQTCFALIGVFTKYIGPSMNSLTLSFFRVFIASIFLLLVAVVFRKTKELTITKKDIVPFFIVGSLFALDFVFFIAAFHYTSLSEVGLLTSIVPVLVYFMAAKFLDEKISKNGIVALGAVLAGLYAINFAGTGGFSNAHILGNIFALVGSVFAAGYITYMRFEERNHSSLDAIFWPMVFATILLLPVILIFNYTAVAQTAYIWVLLLGVVSTGIGYLIVSLALKNMEAHTYSLAATIAFPLISIMFGAFFFSEALTINIIIGGGFMLLSALIVHYENRKIGINKGLLRKVNQKLHNL